MARNGEPPEVSTRTLLASGAGGLFLLGLVLYPSVDTWLTKHRGAAAAERLEQIQSDLEQSRQRPESRDPSLRGARRRELDERVAAAVVTDGPEYPEALPGALEEQRTELGADLAFSLEEGVRTFATHRANTLDWLVLFYREDEDGMHRRVGPVFAPPGFGQPRVTGTPPRVYMEPEDGDESYGFMVYEDRVRLVPAYQLIGGSDDSAGSGGATVFIEPENDTDGARGLRR